MENKGNLKEKINGFVESHSKLQLTIYLIVFLLVFSSVIIALISIPKSNHKNPKKVNPVSQVSEYYQTEDLTKPAPMNVTEEYYFSRDENASQIQDNENWFTIPDENSINELHQANEEVVTDILGVAP